MTDIIPKIIAAGVNFSASGYRSEFSGLDWTFVLLLRGPSAITVDAARDGVRHVWDIPAATTKDWAPGEYAYSIRATNEGDVVEVESGRLRIKPDMATAGAGFDGRTENRKALDAIDAVIANRATVDQASYRINNRELVRTSIADLLKLRTHFFDQVQREEAKARGKSVWGRQVKFVAGSCG